MAPHLSIVPQHASAAPVMPAAAVDRALKRAFSADVHELADLYAVHPITQRLPLDGRGEAELTVAFRAYLDAAARLRARNAAATIEALFAELTVGRRE